MAKFSLCLALLMVAVCAVMGADAVRECPANQVWTDCANPCPLTCEKPKPVPCVKRCDPPACVCQEGYLKKGNDCVKKENC